MQNAAQSDTYNETIGGRHVPTTDELVTILCDSDMIPLKRAVGLPVNLGDAIVRANDQQTVAQGRGRLGDVEDGADNLALHRRPVGNVGRLERLACELRHPWDLVPHDVVRSVGQISRSEEGARIELAIEAEDGGIGLAGGASLQDDRHLERLELHVDADVGQVRLRNCAMFIRSDRHVRNVEGERHLAVFEASLFEQRSRPLGIVRIGLVELGSLDWVSRQDELRLRVAEAPEQAGAHSRQRTTP